MKENFEGETDEISPLADIFDSFRLFTDRQLLTYMKITNKRNFQVPLEVQVIIKERKLNLSVDKKSNPPAET